jgi:hypothetical protein
MTVSSLPRNERSNQHPNPCMIAAAGEGREEESAIEEKIGVKTCAIDAEAIGDLKLLQLLACDGAEVNRMDSAGI